MRPTSLLLPLLLGLALLHYLTAPGAKKEAFTLISYGKERPLVTGHDEQSFWQNCRAHFVLKH